MRLTKWLRGYCSAQGCARRATCGCPCAFPRAAGRWRRRPPDTRYKRYNKDIPSSNLYDTLQLARCVLFEHPVFNLAALSEHYGLDSSGSHRAEKDTENCGFVLLSLLDELIRYPLESISKIISVIEKFDIPNKTLFIDLGNALLHDNDYRVIANKNIDKKPNDKSSIYYCCSEISFTFF